jgi:hypothetical protein
MLGRIELEVLLKNALYAGGRPPLSNEGLQTLTLGPGGFFACFLGAVSLRYSRIHPRYFASSLTDIGETWLRR